MQRNRLPVRYYQRHQTEEFHVALTSLEDFKGPRTLDSIVDNIND